jgi:hypothetical protein
MPIRLQATMVAAAAGAGVVLFSPGEIAGGAEQRVEPSCPKRTLCVYEHDQWEGQRVKITETGISNKLAEQMNNRASSAWNRRGKTAVLYTGKNAHGGRLCIRPGGFPDILSLAGFNDVASSTKLSKKATACPT